MECGTVCATVKPEVKAAKQEKKKEEEAVWLTLQIRQSAPCALRPAVRLEGRFLSGTVQPEPVPGSGDLWQARIPVDRAALHAGRLHPHAGNGRH